MSLTICDVWGVIGTHSASHPALPTIVSAVVARPNAVFWAVEKSWCIPAVYRYTAYTPCPAPLAEVYSSTAVYSGLQYTALQRYTVYSGIHSPSGLLQDAHPRNSKPSAEHLDRGQTINGRTRQHQRSHKFTLRSRETKPFRQSHCHLHPYFLRLLAKQLLFNYCPQMPTYEADTCMQNTASITA